MCSISTSSLYVACLCPISSVFALYMLCCFMVVRTYVCHMMQHSNCIGGIWLAYARVCVCACVCVHVTWMMWMSSMICAAHLCGVLLLDCTTRHTIQCLPCWISVCLCSWERSDIMSCQCECRRVGMPVHYQWYLTERTVNCMHLVFISQVFVCLPG